MNSADRIREIAKKRGIPLSRIERACDFGNGYLGTKKGDLPPLRLKAVADYLGVSTDILTYGEEKAPFIPSTNIYYTDAETAEIAQAFHDNEDLRVLFSAAKDASPQALKDTYEMLMMLKRRERGETD